MGDSVWLTVEHVAAVKGVCSIIKHVSQAAAESALNTCHGHAERHIK